jgi:cyclohexanone monooxygenase
MTDHEVLIIGGGFSGIGAAIALQSAGIEDFALLEKAGELGGTWRENTYPGCACDVPSALYSYSFALHPDWSRVFAPQAEIQAYLKSVAQRHRVPGRTRFHCEVLSGAWDETQQQWILQTTTGPLTSKAIVAAGGPLHEPRIPKLPGLSRFQGELFHSARWNHQLDLTGRRVAVIGTGSSAIQFVPEIAGRAGRLHLFQRTAPWVLPKPDHPIPGLEKALFRHVPGAQRVLRETIYHSLELLQLGQRHPAVMRQVQRIGVAHLRLAVRDDELRRALTPDFTLGCKRLLLSNTYYPALQRENVEVVAHALQRVNARSVVGADGVQRPVDTIILATGFHATDPPIAGLIRGRDGRTLEEAWQGSPSAYIGTTVSNFPNAFLMIGPNLGNGHSSAFVIIEAQLRYITQALLALRHHASIEVHAEVQRAYDAKVQRALAGTVWNAGGCQSYYLDRNGRNAAIYPWTTRDLRRRLSCFNLEEYDVVPARERVAAAA